MRTEYKDLIEQLITNLQNSVKEDLGDPNIRARCSGLMFATYYNMSSLEEKELCTWIMNAGSDLVEQPLEEDHPQYQEEIQEYGEEVLNIARHLKNYLADDHYALP